MPVIPIINEGFWKYFRVFFCADIKHISNVDYVKYFSLMLNMPLIAPKIPLKI